MRYRANTPRFVDETVDGEALIMDMVTGSYYTCLDASTVVWEALTRGLEPREVAEMLASTYPVAMADAERDVETFVAELLGEEMLVPRDRASDPLVTAPVRETPSPAAYEPLRLEKYTDLADLILLDPVHDVSAAGWPHETD